MAFVCRGEGAFARFANEMGGHRWQRIPPTERRGRVHTSTVTVAVLEVGAFDNGVRDSDISITTTTGRGPGGQNRNKVETTVVATHLPTGISVRIDSRSQYQNKILAVQILKAKVVDGQKSANSQAANAERRSQMGSGMRGDKIRTYREKDDNVTDHRTGQKWRLSRWERGDW